MGVYENKEDNEIFRNYRIMENWRKCVKKKKLHILSSHSYIVRGRGIFEAV